MKKILVIGGEANIKNALLIAKLKEEHGNDIILITLEEAKEQGLKMEDFANIPTMKNNQFTNYIKGRTR